MEIKAMPASCGLPEVYKITVRMRNYEMTMKDNTNNEVKQKTSKIKLLGGQKHTHIHIHRKQQLQLDCRLNSISIYFNHPIFNHVYNNNR